jgi:hypothetical protein
MNKIWNQKFAIPSEIIYILNIENFKMKFVAMAG